MSRDSDELTPARAIRKTWGWVPFGLNAVVASAIILAVAVGAVYLLAYLLIPAGGAIQKKTIATNNSNTVNSLAYQVNLVTEMQGHLANITGPGGLASQRASVPADSPEQSNIRASELSELNLLCSEGAQVNWDASIPGAASMQPVYQANCAAGTVVASPPLAPAA